MSIIAVTNVIVGRNPACLYDPLEFEIFIESTRTLSQDLEWKIIYVGDPEDKTKDQELDCISLGPISQGALRFTFVTNAPDFTQIKKEDIYGFTVVLLTGSYRNQEFVRVGYYVHNQFQAQDDLENDPDIDTLTLQEMMARMQRTILAHAPRVTRFQIDWDDDPEMLHTGLSESSSSKPVKAPHLMVDDQTM